MRSIYLVARRDYLGYVSAWGFWLGLLFTPVLLGIFMLAPSLAAKSQPTRYYSIIEQGSEFTAALRAEQSAASITRSANSSGQDDPTAALQIGQPYVEIAPPADTIEGLKPYLSGASLANTPDGPLKMAVQFSIGARTCKPRACSNWQIPPMRNWPGKKSLPPPMSARKLSKISAKRSARSCNSASAARARPVAAD